MIRHKTEVRSAVAGTDGRAAVTFGPVPGDRVWLISHMVAQARTSQTPPVALYLDHEDRAALIEYTPRGALDLADFPAPGLLIPAHSSLVAVWESLDPGDEVWLRIQYQEQAH